MLSVGSHCFLIHAELHHELGEVIPKRTCTRARIDSEDETNITTWSMADTKSNSIFFIHWLDSQHAPLLCVSVFVAVVVFVFIFLFSEFTIYFSDEYYMSELWAKAPVLFLSSLKIHWMNASAVVDLFCHSFVRAAYNFFAANFSLFSLVVWCWLVLFRCVFFVLFELNNVVVFAVCIDSTCSLVAAKNTNFPHALQKENIIEGIFPCVACSVAPTHSQCMYECVHVILQSEKN